MICPHPTIRRPGHTLVELIAALASSTILLAGLAAVMMIASQTAYSPTASAKRLEAAEAVDELANDLRFATFMVTRTTRVLEFVVTDRNGDGAAERIRYEWSGTAGAPLLKTVNGGTPTALVDSVQGFQCSVAIASQTTTVSTTTDSAETVLLSNATVQGSPDRDITTTAYSAQQINPAAFASIPANALSWNATKVDFHGRQEGASTESLLLQLRSTGEPFNSPTSSVLGQITFPESSLSSNFAWSTAVFSDPIRGLALHRRYAVAWVGVGGGKAARLRADNSASSGVLESENAGASWQYMPTRQVFYRLYGTYTLPGPTYNVTHNYATRVDVMLQAGAASHSRIDTSVPLVNRPELLSAYWRTDFDGNPTTTDLTRDGTSDWTMASGSFNNATLVDGVWLADGSLESRPKNNFTTNTTVDVRCRNTSVGGNGAVVRISADRQGGTHALLEVRLQRQSDGSQTLTLYGKASDATDVTLFQRKNLSSDFVRYRLTILPASNVVNLTIQGTDEGGYVYPTYAPADDNRFLTFFANTSSAEYDYVELRVAE